jgi:hypothetical protein
MKIRGLHIYISLAFLILAALLHFWIAPLTEELPADFFNEMSLIDEVKYRDSPTGEWQLSTLNARRVDQSITTFDQIAIIEGAIYSYSESGEVNFQTSSLYGVDRRTRLNLAGYGEIDRSGQYFFPPHVQPVDYQIWDPIFIGLRQAVFERIEQIEGMEVYVFSFSGFGMDETAGYSYLPIVPEQYLAYTDGTGALWVEPLSGIVVDYMDSGVSYFILPSTGERLADFNKWEEQYTSETRASQIELARAARLRILFLDYWLPAGFLAAGVIWLAIGLIRRKRGYK